MPTIAAPSATAACVKTLLERSLHFRVQVTLEEATEVLSSFETYNDMPHSLVGIVEAVKASVGPMRFVAAPGDEPNPNNGKFTHIRFSIGNEGTLVIYVEVAGAYLLDRAPKVERLLRSVGETFQCDEFAAAVDGFGGIEARFWWD